MIESITKFYKFRHTAQKESGEMYDKEFKEFTTKEAAIEYLHKCAKSYSLSLLMKGSNPKDDSITCTYVDKKGLRHWFCISRKNK